MRKENKTLPLDKLELNTGQIPGVPANPRFWSEADVDELVESLKETPLLMEARPPIVYPFKEKYIVIGGNMRVEALRKMGREDCLVYVLPGDLDKDKLRKMIVADNAHFGEWINADLKSWGVRQGWGVPEEMLKDVEQKAANRRIDIAGFEVMMTMVFDFTPEEKDLVEKKLTEGGLKMEEGLLQLCGYEG